jgi:methionine sulfoxide reductase heme-binding subunit
VAQHVGTTVIDTFVHIPLVSAFIPFTSSYQPFWLSLGAVALDLLIALVATSLIRNRLGLRAWRWLHWAAYVCWPVALAHGLGMGTDRNTMWVFALTIVCAAAVAGAATWRFVTAARAGAR